MKKYQINSNDSSILDVLSYTTSVELKTLIKYLLTDDKLVEDESELCIIADLKTYLGLYDNKHDSKILTSRQRVVLIEHLINDRTQADVAEELGITQQGVSILLNSALNRIKNYILTGELKWVEWTDDEKVFLMHNYGRANINKIAKRLGRPVVTVMSMYHYLKNKETT